MKKHKKIITKKRGVDMDAIAEAKADTRTEGRAVTADDDTYSSYELITRVDGNYIVAGPEGGAIGSSFETAIGRVKRIVNYEKNVEKIYSRDSFEVSAATRLKNITSEQLKKKYEKYKK